MNLATRKYNFIQELTTIDESLLEKLEMVLKSQQKNWFYDLSLKKSSLLDQAFKGEL